MEKKNSITLSGWIAMDKDGDMAYLHEKKPIRYKCEGIEYWVNAGKSYRLPSDIVFTMFPNFDWNDEPIQVEISINQK